MQKLKDVFDALLGARPTGRPDFHSIMKTIEEKYKEAKENMAPSGSKGKHGHHHDHEYKKAYDQVYIVPLTIEIINLLTFSRF